MESEVQELTARYKEEESNSEEMLREVNKQKNQIENLESMSMCVCVCVCVCTCVCRIHIIYNPLSQAIKIDSIILTSFQMT